MTDEELLQKLEDLTKNAQHHHLETLRSILLHNGIVHYLQSFKKGSLLHLDPSTFARVVPLSTYEDYVDYINQMAEGKDDPFLSVDPLCYSLNPSLSSIVVVSPCKSHTSSSFIPHCFTLLKPSSCNKYLTMVIGLTFLQLEIFLRNTGISIYVTRIFYIHTFRHFQHFL